MVDCWPFGLPVLFQIQVGAVAKSIVTYLPSFMITTALRVHCLILCCLVTCAVIYIWVKNGGPNFLLGTVTLIC